MKKLIIGFRSYSAITTSTDHKLVKMKLTILKIHQILNLALTKTGQLDFYHPIDNFLNLVSNNYSNIEAFQNIVLKSALKFFKKLENKLSLNENSDIKNKINGIRKKLNNCKMNHSIKIKLNKEKHYLQKQINKSYFNNSQTITEEQLKDIENFNYNSKMYKAIKFFKINNFINKAPPPTPYSNQDLTTHHNTTTTILTTQILKFIEIRLNHETKSDRFFGHDKIQAELVKLLNITTIEKLTHIINSAVNNELPHELGLSILIPITNLDKTKNVQILGPQYYS